MFYLLYQIVCLGFFFHQKSYTFQRDGDYQAIALDEDYDRENQQVIYLGTGSSFSWN